MTEKPTFIDSVHQRINQVNSEVGWAAVLDFGNQDIAAEQISRNDFSVVVVDGAVAVPKSPAELHIASEQDNTATSRSLGRDPDAQALAKELVAEHHKYTGADGSNTAHQNYWYKDHWYYDGEPKIGEPTLIVDHKGPQYDHNDFDTQNRLYALMAIDPRGLIPLSKEYTWREVAERYLKRWKGCDIRVSTQCQDGFVEDGVIAIKTGEFVCLFKACAECRRWFDLPIKSRDMLRYRLFGTADSDANDPWNIDE